MTCICFPEPRTPRFCGPACELGSYFTTFCRLNSLYYTTIVMAGSFGEFSHSRAIADLYKKCFQSFQNLDSALLSTGADGNPPESKEAEASTSQQMRETLQTLLGRFKIWAANCGAHQVGKSSLDHRLQEANHIQQEVVILLRDLEKALQEGLFPIFHKLGVKSYQNSLHHSQIVPIRFRIS